jgi:predicted nucleotidyltransferase
VAAIPSGQRTLQALARASKDLHELGASFALIGGLAVAALAVPRLTKDVDFAVAVTAEEDAERLVNDLCSRGYSVESVLERRSSGRLATVRLRSAAGALVDLLFASSGAEHEIVAAARIADVLGQAKVPVARVGHLLALKVLSRDDTLRPQDYDDLQALLEIADAAERRCALATLKLIERRGFGRRRKLITLWRRALAERPQRLGSLRRPGTGKSRSRVQ